ncbi:MAG: ABC transporter permease [Balneolaceae bacterium]|nr:ABC transporter permease [Balneolaceae bacterium]MBO6544777.1 ABC transporter permease [Balneolaceae bacterium]MBO6646173.1 ABC transporter permease [Balneolaceae bacterium]
MIKNYLKIAYRGFLKRKSYSFINLFGLSTGIACCIIILLFVTDELSYDSFHENSDRIVRVQRQQINNIGDVSRNAAINYSLADLTKEHIADVEATTRIAKREVHVKIEDQVFTESGFLFAEPSFFDMFSVKLLSGSTEASLSSPMSVLLTPKMAVKYFGEMSPIGQTLTINDEHLFTVTGIVQEMPGNSHFHYDFIASMESTKSMFSNSMFEHWGNIWVYTYALIRDGADIGNVQSELDQMISEFGPPALAQFGVSFYLHPLSEIYFYSKTNSEIEPSGNALFVYVFLVVAILILLIACFNFINLSTARSSWRAKEVGVRKVLGASRKSLIRQFLSESVLYSFVAFLLAILFIEFSLPTINNFLAKDLSLNLFNDFQLLAGLIFLFLFVGIFAGSYPSLILSAFTPSKALKGNGKSEGGFNTYLRKGLVVFQFSISTILILGTMVVYTQLQFIKNKDIGLNKDQVIVLKLNNPDSRSQTNSLKQALLSNTNILGVAGVSDELPTSLNSWRVRKPGASAETEELLKVMAVDPNFFKVLDIELVSGRNFSEERISDLNSAVILNQTAAEHFGFETPVGEQLYFSTTDRTTEIIGISEDFHNQSLHSDIIPIAFHFYPTWIDNLYIKVSADNLSETINAIENEWRSNYPGSPFEYSFLDNSFEQLYQADQKLGVLIGIFSLLAIVIASLGLLGLASFTTELRFKEIGVRKVLGASISDILQLLSKDYFLLLIISMVVAIPTAYFIMQSWLTNFTYRISFSPWLFAGAAAITILIALFAVSTQSIKAATMNPVDSLKSE